MIDENVAVDIYKRVNIIMEAMEGTNKNPFYTAVTTIAEKNNWNTPLVLLYFYEGHKKITTT